MLPRPYPDEMAVSLVIREAAWYGVKLCELQRLIGPVPASFYAPVELLQWLYQRYCSGLMSEYEFLQQHTLYPMHTCFMQERLRIQPREESGGSLIELYAELAGGSHRLYSSMMKFNLRFCPHCLREQFDRCGEIYLLREWFVQGSCVCAKHGRLLTNLPLTVRDCIKKAEKIRAELLIKEDEAGAEPKLGWTRALAADLGWLFNAQPGAWNWYEEAQQRLERLTPDGRGALRFGSVKKLLESRQNEINLKDMQELRRVSRFSYPLCGTLYEGEFIPNWLLMRVLFPGKSLEEVHKYVCQKYNRL